MKARESVKMREFFKDEKGGRKLIIEIMTNDKMDGKAIKTTFGNVFKL